VVAVTSATYRFGRIHPDDLNCDRRKYSPMGAYADSKLAVLLFVHELARRGMRAYASDPGMTNTEITRASGRASMSEHPARFILQSPAQGARASVEAATTDLPSGTYLAPRFNQWGTPRVTRPGRRARDPQMARRLWDLSAELTGCD
jgi:hypothetical protein